jgi:hypothetical protein
MEFQNLIEKRRSVRKYVERNMVTKDEILSMIKAAQEAPSWKNSQTGRYYCIMDEKNVEQFRRECLPEMNAGKCENAVLLVSTFVHNRAGFQKDGTADNEIGNGWGCYDLGLQNENLILKAEELGYGTLIMGIRDADKIREFCSGDGDCCWGNCGRSSRGRAWTAKKERYRRDSEVFVRSVKGGCGTKQFFSDWFWVLRKAKAGKSAKRRTQPQTILFGSVSGLKKS